MQNSIGNQKGFLSKPAQAGFYLHLQMASCILSSSKYFQYLKTLALAEGKNASEVSVFI